jgi:hypothetical protein
VLLLLDNLDTGPGADRADAMHGKANLLPKSSTALTKARGALWQDKGSLTTAGVFLPPPASGFLPPPAMRGRRPSLHSKFAVTNPPYTRTI